MSIVTTIKYCLFLASIITAPRVFMCHRVFVCIPRMSRHNGKRGREQWHFVVLSSCRFIQCCVNEMVTTAGQQLNPEEA